MKSFLIIGMGRFGRKLAEDLLERTPVERLEQFLCDGDDRDIAARYCGGVLVKKPFATME